MIFGAAVAAVAAVGGFVFAGWAGLFVVAALGYAFVWLRRLPVPVTPPELQVAHPKPVPPRPSSSVVSVPLSSASWSARHYDHGARLLLWRLMRARASETRRLDLVRDPQAGRAHFGELWPLVDATRRPRERGDEPGVDIATLSAIVDRLEAL